MKIQTNIYLFFFLTFGFSLTAVANKTDSLTKELNSPVYKNDLSAQYRLHFELAEEFYFYDLFEKAREHYMKGLELGRTLESNKFLFDILLGLGKANERLNDYPTALEYFFEIVEYEDDQVSPSVKGESYSRIGSIYQALGDYDKAYQYQVQALSIHEMEEDLGGQTRDLYIIGSIFFYQKRFEQALEYYEKAKLTSERADSERLMYSCLGALGTVYSELNDYEKSLEYNNLSLELARKLNYKTGIAYSLGNLANAKLMNGEVAEAKELLKESLNLKTELNDRWAIIGGHLSLVDVYNNTNEPLKTLPHLKKAMDLAKKIGSKTRRMDIYQAYKESYLNLNDAEKAFYYLEQYVALKDSVLNEKTLEEMGQTKKRYEIEKKESEIALLKSENKLLEQNKKIQQLQKFIFSTVAFALLIVCWFGFSRLKFQRTTNTLLEEKNAEIQNQNSQLQNTQNQLVESNALLEEKNQLLASKNDEIHIKNKLLEDSNEDLQNFAYVASHDLKEPLRMISSYTTLLEKRYNDKLDESGKEFMHFIVDAVDRMKVMLDDLLSYSRVGTNNTFKDQLDMEDIMIIVESNLRPRLEEQNASLTIHKENLPVLKSNSTQMVQLMQNLISNAVKFRGEKDPEVVVDCFQKDGNYVFSVKDNGIGISEENKKKVFEMFRRLHTKEEYEGTGIGLATCKKIVQKHGGEIWVESEYGNGSTFFFSIPCTIPQNVAA